MYKGGYQILDCKETVLTSGTAKTITGSYARIHNNTGKPILVSGCIVKNSANGDAVALTDCWVNFTVNNGTYTGTLSNGGTLAITSADAVTYTHS